MKDYTIYYKNGTTESVSYPDKNSLIASHFNGDKHKFNNEVERLSWQTLSTLYTEDIQTNECHAQIITADVNPYGWRNA